MKKNWDLEAIDQVFEKLIDEFRHQLDSIVLTGFRVYLEKQPIFRQYLVLLENLEKELLIQWNIKQTQGLDALFMYHNRWLGEELRKKISLFDQWMDLCVQLWNECDPPESMYLPSIWKSFVLKSVSEPATWSQLSIGLRTDQKDTILEKISQILELLINADPHHQILSFLNIVELGVNDRPLICEIGAVPEHIAGQSVPKLVKNSILPTITNDRWEEMPKILHKFWQEKQLGDDD